MRLELAENASPAVIKSIQAMYTATADDRGTVQALSREINQITEDGT